MRADFDLLRDLTLVFLPVFFLFTDLLLLFVFVFDLLRPIFRERFLFVGRAVLLMFLVVPGAISLVHFLPNSRALLNVVELNFSFPADALDLRDFDLGFFLVRLLLLREFSLASLNPFVCSNMFRFTLFIFFFDRLRRLP